MNRIDRVFAQAKQQKRPVVVAYLCVGDPDLDTSFELARALLRSGADILELGTPFSDPTADGPVIARASARAITRGGSLRTALELSRKLRAESDAPMILFGYMNPIAIMGERACAIAAREAGADGLLIVDLPPEEGLELRDEARRQGLVVVPLLTPTSERARIEAARPVAEGFVYYVSVTGVTGPGSSSGSGGALTRFDESGLAAARLRDDLRLPVVVGFGIDSAEKAAHAWNQGRGADGVVVGSAIVRAVESAGDDRAAAVRSGAAVLSDICRGLA